LTSKKEKSFPNQSVEIKEGKIVRILPEIVEETGHEDLGLSWPILGSGSYQSSYPSFWKWRAEKASMANKGKSQARLLKVRGSRLGFMYLTENCQAMCSDRPL
jgi:hypothetical protein